MEIIVSKYVFVVSFVLLPSTVAIFFISVPFSKSCTVTLNERVVVPAVSPLFAGTFTVIPLSNSVSPKFDVFSLLLISMLPGTNVVPVGIVS